MIQFISSWAEQVILAVIIATILEMILPNGKSKKYIKTVIGIYILFVIIYPFSNAKDVISSTNIDLDEYTESSTQVDQTSMDKRLEKLYIEELEENISKNVEEEGYKVESCSVDAKLLDEETGGIKKISLIISYNSNIVEQVEEIKVSVENSDSAQDENVNSEDIKALKKTLSSYYEISEDIIFINNS